MPSYNGHGPKRAILYARVSTSEQARNGYSLPQQLEALREYAVREGYEVLEEVSDPSQSGASLERPGMDHVRDLVAAGGVSVVLAQDRDRFSREPAYTYILRRELEEHGCVLKALNDRGGESPEGELTDGILDQLAKYERAKIAERSSRGKLRKAREGKVVAGPRIKYGFKLNATRDGLLVDEEKMRIVRRIFHMRGVEGLSQNTVYHALEREGIPTPGGGKYWDRAFIKLCILDDAYRPHTFEEVKAIVSPDVAAKLDPDQLYGIWWFNRLRVHARQVSEPSGNGARRYRKEVRTTDKPKEEWIGVPVPYAGIPLEVVNAARNAIKNHRIPSILGGDSGNSPVESSVAACVATLWRTDACRRGAESIFTSTTVVEGTTSTVTPPAPTARTIGRRRLRPPCGNSSRLYSKTPSESRPGSRK
jgi:site-specific DNA recombinase